MPPTTPITLCRKRWTRTIAAFAAVALSFGTLAAPPAEADEDSHEPKTVVYVEVNSNDFANVADYTLSGTDRPAFDIGIIFAANINHDGEGAVLHLNEQVTETLENAATQIRPVQERGTKVLLSVLGNHQGAGIANLADYADADAFAAQIEEVVEKYGLDGIDFDDEWSGYGANGTAEPNDWSFVYLVHALRNRLGNEKIISFYDIGPAADATEYKHMYAGDWLNYAWNPYYGSWKPPVIEHMGTERLGAAAVDLSRTSAATATALVQRTVDEGYGVLVTYNLTDTNQEEYISLITNVLKGRATYNEKFPDTVLPQVVLDAPAANSVVKKLRLSVSASDDRGLTKIVADVHRDGKLIKHTQTRTSGISATHTAHVSLPDGIFEIRYSAVDAAGNFSAIGTANVTVDTTRPGAEIKAGNEFTVPGPRDTYTMISFKLSDENMIDKVVLNGVTKDLTDAKWSDLNGVQIGTFGAVKGNNTLKVHDLAGNVTTVKFRLS